VKIRSLAVLLLLATVCSGQDNSGYSLSGTVVNTTNADAPVAAPVRFAVIAGVCKLTISPPLLGSGGCNVKSYDQKTGHLEIVSYGPPTISWSGTVKGNFASGVYSIDVGRQGGTFYLAVLRESEKQPRPIVAPPATAPAAPSRGSCVPAIESSISGDINGWEGETTFKLANGQIWQQAEYDYTYFYEYSPDVTIYQTSAGCRMKVEDEEETVLVKRIK
jgi:hypothetical protein